MNNLLYQGVVENRNDPMKLGRCQVRVVGIHTQNKIDLRTDDLPWAYPIQPITSAAISGIGHAPVGPVPGTWVIIMFRDDEQQEPLMLGTIGGIPQSKQAQMSSNNNSNVIATGGGTLTDSSGTTITTSDGTPITVGSAESQATPAPTAKPSVDPSKAIPASIFLIPIPIIPPPNSGANVITATKNISGIISACDKVGLTSKYAKCAILGIVGGETKWDTVEEGYKYSDPVKLARIFSKTFKGDLELAKKYCKWTGSRKDFFDKIYDPAGNGATVGNKEPGDGGKYYGRGFNQLTGRPNYLATMKELKKKGIDLDLMDKPELMNDPTTAALACAIFYVLRCKHDMNDPGYFTAALKATGNNVGDAYIKKQKFYEYFLGQSATVESTNKPSTDSQKEYTPEEIAAAPAASQAALSEDRTTNELIGFCDPNGKYPLRDHMNEPDTNRMARGITNSTAIAFKDASRTTQIPRALGSGTWDQPPAPFGGVYPYAKVFESESGHVNMVDDSPGNETVSTFHRKGTYTEVDANGTQVNKIVGDNYIIMDRNGSIYVSGSTQITFGGYANINILGVADVEINGKTTVHVNDDAEIAIAGDLTMAVGGKFDLQVGKAFDIKTGVALGVEWKEGLSLKSNDHVYWKDNVYYAEVDVKLKGPEPIHITGTKESLTFFGYYDINTFNVESRTGSNFRTGTSFSVESTTDSSFKAGGSISESAPTMNISAATYNETVGDSNYRWEKTKRTYVGGNTHERHNGGVDHSCSTDPSRTGANNCGNVASAAIAPLAPFSKVSLLVPDRKPALGSDVTPLETPERNLTSVADFETSDEQQTPEGQIASKIADANTPPGIKSDPTYAGNINNSASPIPGGVVFVPAAALLSDIRSRTDFPNTYKISKNFTIANMTGGEPFLIQKQLPGNAFGKARILTVAQTVENMAYLAENVLEVIYGIYGPAAMTSRGGGKPGGVWQINSGLRLNGSPTSEHNEGMAVDLRPANNKSDDTFNMAKNLVTVLKFNNFLLEYRSPPATAGWQRWIHISYRVTGNTTHYATYINDKVKQKGALLQLDSAKL